MKMTDYIYSRVSCKSQDTKSQAQELLNVYPNAIVHEEQQSGKYISNRPVFLKLLSSVESGDRIIVRELSRLGRNTNEVLKLFDSLDRKGVAVIIKELQIDSTTATGKMILTIMASVATMERELILERQAAGIKTAKERGAYKGRKANPRTILKCEEALNLINKMGYSKEKASKAVGVGTATLYRYLNSMKSAKP